MNSFKDTEIYRLAFDLAIKVYVINMALPRHELIKEGNMLRRSSIGIKDTIADGYSQVKILRDIFVHFTMQVHPAMKPSIC